MLVIPFVLDCRVAAGRVAYHEEVRDQRSKIPQRILETTVETITTGQWMLRPPQRCPRGHASRPSPPKALRTTAAQLRGRGETPWLTTTSTAARRVALRGRRRCGQ